MTQEQKKFIEKIETIIDNWDSLVEWKKDTTEHCILPEHYKGIVRDIKLELTSLDNWISVLDELPKDNKNDEDREFIVEIEIKHSCVYPVTSAQWDSKEQRFYKGSEYLKVIRWQPHPQPPKED